MILPDYMMHGGLQIAYQPTRYIVFSCAGSYSHANNLDFRWASPMSPPVLNFTCLCIDFQVSYTNRIIGNLHYLIGTGFDILHLRVFQDDTTLSNSDLTFSSTYLRPLVSGGLRFDVNHRLYSQLQVKCCFYHLMKFGGIQYI
jgi:hypothetical protein